MSLFVASLNSGSNGNCYYAGTHREAILVDAGLSCRETEKRLKDLGLDISLVKAIFISHEHTDHISGLATLVKKHGIPVYANKKTARHFQEVRSAGLLNDLTADEEIQVGELFVTAFSKHHDADDPVSFTIRREQVRVGVYTDIGKTCHRLISHFKTCHAAFLEANYDTEMLLNGPYPAYLKKRIHGDEGHLSNEAALELFIKHKASGLSHLFLSHLSKENNHPEKAKELFQTHAGETEIIVASRFGPTALYHITGEKTSAGKSTGHVQMRLF